MSFLKLSKRKFLLSGASLVSFTLPLSACRNEAAIGDKPLDSTNSNHDIFRVFIARLFPINAIDPSVLSDVSDGLFKSAKTNVGLAGSLSACIQAVQKFSENDWLKLEPSQQTAIMQKLEGEPWFGAILFQAKGMLFNNPKLWRALGYGGSSLEEGGYKYNGFDDIDWLPEVSE